MFFLRKNRWFNYGTFVPQKTIFGRLLWVGAKLIKINNMKFKQTTIKCVIVKEIKLMYTQLKRKGHQKLGY